MDILVALENVACELYGIAAEHDMLVRVGADDADDRWVDAYNMVMQVISRLENE